MCEGVRVCERVCEGVQGGARGQELKATRAHCILSVAIAAR